MNSGFPVVQNSRCANHRPFLLKRFLGFDAHRPTNQYGALADDDVHRERACTVPNAGATFSYLGDMPYSCDMRIRFYTVL